MIWKRKYIGIALVACTIALSLSVVSVLASPAWTIDDLLYFFEQGDGRRWLQRTNSRVFKILEKMGQGLVGEVEEGNIDTKFEWVTVLYYSPPHPKKVSLYVDTGGSADGDSIVIFRKVLMHGAWRDLEPVYWTNEVDPMQENLLLILDQLPAATTVWVAVHQLAGNAFTLWWQSIIEEV